jgi:hypothetical protein
MLTRLPIRLLGLVLIAVIVYLGAYVVLRLVDPDRIHTTFTMADQHIEQGNISHAQRDLARLIEDLGDRKPTARVKAMLGIGACQMALDRMPDALSWFDKATKLAATTFGEEHVVTWVAATHSSLRLTLGEEADEDSFVRFIALQRDMADRLSRPSSCQDDDLVEQMRREALRLIWNNLSITYKGVGMKADAADAARKSRLAMTTPCP